MIDSLKAVTTLMKRSLIRIESKVVDRIEQCYLSSQSMYYTKPIILLSAIACILWICVMCASCCIIPAHTIICLTVHVTGVVDTGDEVCACGEHDFVLLKCDVYLFYCNGDFLSCTDHVRENTVILWDIPKCGAHVFVNTSDTSGDLWCNINDTRVCNDGLYCISLYIPYFSAMELICFESLPEASVAGAGHTNSVRLRGNDEHTRIESIDNKAHPDHMQSPWDYVEHSNQMGCKVSNTQHTRSFTVVSRHTLPTKQSHSAVMNRSGKHVITKCASSDAVAQQRSLYIFVNSMINELVDWMKYNEFDDLVQHK